MINPYGISHAEITVAVAIEQDYREGKRKPEGINGNTAHNQNIRRELIYDLLDTSESLRLSKNPTLLFHEAQRQPPHSWIVIDEVQKVPALLDEVHRLIEQRNLHFILSGSSARKLRLGGVNLLAGRAMTTHLFPFVSSEVNFDIKIPSIFVTGMLPMAITHENPTHYLTTYAETYLQQEIKAEALTRNIGHFARFLEIASRQNGQITNVSSIARDAGITRQTVQNYFEVLCDVLIGYWLRPWKLKSSTKQVAYPKFYFFDAGVARALSGRLPYPPTNEELGPLIETMLLHECGPISPMRNYITPSIIAVRPKGWKSTFSARRYRDLSPLKSKDLPPGTHHVEEGLKRLQEKLGRDRITVYGIYLGKRSAYINDITVLPILDFLRQLNGEIVR